MMPLWANAVIFGLVTIFASSFAAYVEDRRVRASLVFVAVGSACNLLVTLLKMDL